MDHLGFLSSFLFFPLCSLFTESSWNPYPLTHESFLGLSSCPADALWSKFHVILWIPQLQNFSLVLYYGFYFIYLFFILVRNSLCSFVTSLIPQRYPSEFSCTSLCFFNSCLRSLTSRLPPAAALSMARLLWDPNFLTGRPAPRCLFSLGAEFTSFAFSLVLHARQAGWTLLFLRRRRCGPSVFSPWPADWIVFLTALGWPASHSLPRSEAHRIPNTQWWRRRFSSRALGFLRTSREVSSGGFQSLLCKFLPK